MTTPEGGTALLERTETQHGSVAHIVKQVPGKSAQALVLEAVVEGLEIEALCGHRWVPSKDPKSLPLCHRCKDIADGVTDGQSGEIT